MLEDFRANVLKTIGSHLKWFSTNQRAKYRKIPRICPGLIFVQKAVLPGLFSGELIFGGAYCWKEFCISKWVGLDNKNSLKSL